MCIFDPLRLSLKPNRKKRQKEVLLHYQTKYINDHKIELLRVLTPFFILARLASPYMMTHQGMMAPMMQQQVMMTPTGQLVQGMGKRFFNFHNF